jgi:lipoprotein-anchoring transpeptidase ErfK/SrfK
LPESLLPKPACAGKSVCDDKLLCEGSCMSGFAFSARFRHPVSACLMLGMAALALAPMPALADPARGAMGGGFIEFLMTGTTPQHRQGAPVYAAPRGPSMPRAIPVARPVMPAPDYRPDIVPVPVPRGGSVQQQAFAGPARLEDDPRSLPAVIGRGVQRDRTPAPIQPGFDPRFEKQEIAYNGPHAPGTLVIDTPSKYLYLVQGNGRALRYGIGVGRPGFEWAGVKTISMKRTWPDWRPPSEMLKRRPDLPRYMAGGPENPLGARAMYLGSSLYRIHGTNEPETIGRAVSSGCIRMRNQDVEDLYERVRVGTKVIVI